MMMMTAITSFCFILKVWGGQLSRAGRVGVLGVVVGGGAAGTGGWSLLRSWGGAWAQAGKGSCWSWNAPRLSETAAEDEWLCFLLWLQNCQSWVEGRMPASLRSIATTSWETDEDLRLAAQTERLRGWGVFRFRWAEMASLAAAGFQKAADSDPA